MESVMNSNIVDVVVTVIIAILSSTGLWKYLETRKTKIEQAIIDDDSTHCNMKELMLYLAKVQICHTATIYLERGWISNTEADMLEHLFLPYHELGGNGSGEVLYQQAMNLPRRNLPHEEKKENE